MSTPSYVITFDLDEDGRPVTSSGQPVTCDGCGVRLTTQPTAAQQQPVPRPIALRAYGRPVITYIVCDRGVLCFDLALLSDELYLRVACFRTDCDCHVSVDPSR